MTKPAAVPSSATDVASLIRSMMPKWSDYIPVVPTPKQMAFLLLPHKEAFFGGAAGGGKSEALLIAALQYVDVPGYSAIIFRKTLADLKLPESLLSRAHKWALEANWKALGAKWVPSEHTFYFPTRDVHGNPGAPAKLVFGYIGEEAVYTRYQGAEFQYIAFDELTQHWEEDYLYLFSRRRRIKCTIHKTVTDEDGNLIKGFDPNCPVCTSSAQVPLRVRAASNPGGRGHAWVRDRFQIEPEPNPEKPGQVRYVGKHPDRPFVPSFVDDNEHLDKEEYKEGLENLDPVTRQQLRDGNWGVSKDSRFKPHWFKRRYYRRGELYHLTPECSGACYNLNQFMKLFVTVDTAASAKEGPGDTDRYRKEKSWTVLALWGLTPDYQMLLLDVDRFREEIPEILIRMKVFHRKWRPQYYVMESVGTGKGVFQQASRDGFIVQPYYPHTDKIQRSVPAQVRAEQGHIWLPAANPGPGWLKDWENEVFTWTGLPNTTDDQIDTLSMAVSHVAWEAASNDRNLAGGNPDDPAGGTLLSSEAPLVVYQNQFGPSTSQTFYGSDVTPIIDESLDPTQISSYPMIFNQGGW